MTDRGVKRNIGLLSKQVVYIARLLARYNQRQMFSDIPPPQRFVDSTQVQSTIRYVAIVQNVLFSICYKFYSSRRPRSTPVDEACDIRLDRRRSRSGVSSGFVRFGSMIALSRAYGNPRCRPRIWNRKYLIKDGQCTIKATITSLLSVLNCDENEALTVGYPYHQAEFRRGG